jgi:hypothetical protein
VTFDSLEQINVGEDSSAGEAGGENDGSEGTTGNEGADGDASGDETSGDGSTNEGSGVGDSAPSTSVEVLVDPSAANGVNSGGPARWGGSIFDTRYVTGTTDGYLRGIRDEEVNKNATTQIGKLTDTPPGDNVVFLIANIGPEESTNIAPPVTVTMRLLSNGEVFTTGQIRFPYRVLNVDQNVVSSGANLATAGGVELATGEVIEVVIVIDTTDGASDLGRLSGIQFFATE